MIQANELRLGNLLSFFNGIEPEKIITINARFFSSLAGGRPSIELKNDEYISGYYRPIPLTEEWMNKLGFIGIANGFIGGNNWWCGRISSNFNDGKVKVWITGCDINLSHIQYVHQLQNLYFALTGKELEIKELK